MKYMVKFKCYQYNTGEGNNCHYINNEKFDTLEEAKAFEQRVKKQYQIFNDNSGGWIERNEEWKNSENFIDIEDGYISDPTTSIVGYYPAKEVKL